MGISSFRIELQESMGWLHHAISIEKSVVNFVTIDLACIVVLQLFRIYVIGYHSEK